MGLLPDGYEEGIALKKQVDFLSDIRYDYTGLGVFVTFSYSNGISNYKTVISSRALDGVDIQSPELEGGAQALVHLRDGIIHELEAVSLGGGYPKREISSYTLKQILNGSPQKTIIRN